MRRATEISDPAIQKAFPETPGFRGVITACTWAPPSDLAHSALITRNEHHKPVVVTIVSEQRQ
jgi:hypothetical protein